MNERDKVGELAAIITGTEALAIECVGARPSSRMIAIDILNHGYRRADDIINDFSERLIRYYNTVGGSTNAALTAYTIRSHAAAYIDKIREENK